MLKLKINTHFVELGIYRESTRARIAYYFFLAYTKGYDVDRINKIYLYFANKDFKRHDITKSVYYSWLNIDGKLNTDKVWGFMQSKEIMGKSFSRREDALRCSDYILSNFETFFFLLDVIEGHFENFEFDCSKSISMYDKIIYK